MKSLLAGAVLPALLLLTAAGPASALTPKVNDEAGFFSPAAVEKANDVIDDIRHKYHKDLLVETFKTVPSDEADRVKNMGRQDRDRFFHEWARERAKEAGVNGVYVLITKEPGRIQVEAGTETLKHAFTARDRDRLRDILVERFRAKDYDKGLLDAVEFVRSRMDENLSRGEAGVGGGGPEAPGQAPPPGAPRRAPQAPWGGLGWLIPLGVLILGVIVVFLVIRWLARSVTGYGSQGGYPAGYGPQGGYGYPGGYGGGGGFLSSLFGSLFGSAAGNWAYDRFFRGHPNQGGNWPADAGSPGGTREREAEDRDYSGAGGDFDDSAPEGGSSGPELGSGSFFGGGGGDSGGGGGGDFGGGGGGDFGGGGGGDSGSGGDF
jgi:uncharacterized protein